MLRDSDLLSIQEARTKVEQAYAAFQHYRRFCQKQVDTIVEAMAEAARAHAQRLAELAVAETGYGNAKDKLTKNLLACERLLRAIRGMKTIGVLREIPEKGITEIGVPVGVVAAILPTTNPTSTAIYKTIIALKAGNAVVVSPHPRAKSCSCATMGVLSEAAHAAGAPEGLIQCIQNATMEGTEVLMHHPRTSVILATGGAGIVKAAYSSGKPAYGVGPGNVPVLLDQSANVAEAVAKVIEGKSFDYGTLCSSEQSLVALASQRTAVLDELRNRKVFLCDDAQTKALEKILISPSWRINPECVGQAPTKIARMAGFEVPTDTSILAAEIGGVGKQHPLSMEKLSPVLSLIFVQDWEQQIQTCQAILKFGGLGHTCGIHSKDDSRIREYGLRMPAFRVVVNTPTPLGSTGVTTGLQPAMTLGCGAIAGNATSDNVGPQHLMNIKRVAYPLLDASRTGEAPSPSVAVSNVAAIVDRFLSERTTRKPSTPPEEVKLPAPAPQTPEVPIVDFVCEADVRTAIKDSKKIYIGTKTIVTPAARDLANAHGILVQARR